MGSLTVDIPADLAERIAAEIQAGTFASESEVVLAGLEAVLNRDAQVEAWLRDTVLASCRETSADPSLAVSIAEIETRLRDRTRDLA